MAIHERIELYRALEAKRGRPLVVYVTSMRRGQHAAGAIGGDVVPELHRQLEALPDNANALDLLVVSYGGDPTVAWRIVSLIRERVKHFSVLVPEAAFSAATLIALGADEIVMHRHGNLGPTDPQIMGRAKDRASGATRFGSEDLAAFLSFAREDVGLTDQAHLVEVFKQFCGEVGSIGIGVAARSSRLAVSLGEKLLQLHLKESEREKARAISEALNRSFFHHGYPLSHTEAVQIGLDVAEVGPEVERLMWLIWLDIEAELKLREPFLPIRILKEDPNCAQLFAAVPQVNCPSNLSPQIVQQLMQQALQQVAVSQIPPASYDLINAVLESPRVATRCVTRGRLFATRLPDLQIRIAQVVEELGWVNVALPKATVPITKGRGDATKGGRLPPKTPARPASKKGSATKGEAKKVVEKGAKKAAKKARKKGV